MRVFSSRFSNSDSTVFYIMFWDTFNNPCEFLFSQEKTTKDCSHSFWSLLISRMSLRGERTNFIFVKSTCLSCCVLPKCNSTGGGTQTTGQSHPHVQTITHTPTSPGTCSCQTSRTKWRQSYVTSSRHRTPGRLMRIRWRRRN